MGEFLKHAQLLAFCITKSGQLISERDAAPPWLV